MGNLKLKVVIFMVLTLKHNKIVSKVLFKANACLEIDKFMKTDAVFVCYRSL